MGGSIVSKKHLELMEESEWREEDEHRDPLYFRGVSSCSQAALTPPTSCFSNENEL